MAGLGTVRLVVFSLLLAVVSADCVAVNVTDVSWCFPYVRPYTSSVYVITNSATQVQFATILQQYCDIFLDYSLRKHYWAVSCALAYPKCQNGLPLLLCPSGPQGCSSILPPYVCTNQMPIAKEGEPCTPIGAPYSELPTVDVEVNV